MADVLLSGFFAFINDSLNETLAVKLMVIHFSANWCAMWAVLPCCDASLAAEKKMSQMTREGALKPIISVEPCLSTCSLAQPHLKHTSIVSVFASCRNLGWGSLPSGNRWACDIIAHPTSNPPLLISDQSGCREARSREGSLPLPDSTLALVAMVTNTGPASILLWLGGGEEGDKGERREEEWKGSRSEEHLFLKAQLVPACLSSVQ